MVHHAGGAGPAAHRGQPRGAGGVQSCAGAALLWRFSYGYRSSHRFAEHVPLPLTFLVLPLLFHEPTYEFLKGTLRSSGLHAFVAKFSESKHSKNDLLISIHGRAEMLRGLTLESLRVGQRGRLVQLTSTGHVICLTDSATAAGDSGIRTLMTNAEKFGAWCAGLTMQEIAVSLKIRF